MTAATAQCDEGSGTALRWTACLVVMLGLHTGAAWMLLRHAPLTEVLPPAPEAVLVDLAPEPGPAAPMPEPTPPLPTPVPDSPTPAKPPLPEPPLPEPAAAATPPEPPPALKPEAVLPEPPLPLPRPTPLRPAPPRPAPPHTPPRPAARPAPQGHRAQTAHALTPALPSPAPATATPPSNAVPSWRGDVAGRLQRAKRYPEAARAHGEQGVATATFTVDRSGRVLSASVVRSSNSRLLDEEAVALIRRAEPLPPMPADMPGSTATLTVPVTFSLR